MFAFGHTDHIYRYYGLYAGLADRPKIPATTYMVVRSMYLADVV